MSQVVSVSELKARLSHYLRLVRAGEVLLVQDRDRVVARLEGAGPGRADAGDERLARLEAAGVLRRRRAPLDPALLARRVRANADVVGAALADRAESR